MNGRFQSRLIASLIGLSASFGIILPSVDGHGLTLSSWVAYSALALISSALIFLIWRAVGGENSPGWLLTAALIAFALRLSVGTALYRAIPIYGYGERAERAGYVYWDAFKRDADAYARGRGEVPLVASFTDPKRSDQYGGLLFVSAGIYRYLGTDEHRPLLPVTLLAGISSLAVILCWGVGRRLFNSSVATAAAWIAVFYPEAVLLGSSQMREPFLITAFAACIYGYLVVRQGRTRSGLIWMVAAVALFTLPISPPFVAVIMLTLALAWLWEQRTQSLRTWLLLAAGLLVITAAALLTVNAWSGLEAIEGSPQEVIQAWIGNAIAGWRVTRVTEQSVWLDTLITDMPDPLHLPFLVLFGLIQPFLPAALVAPGSVLWKSIAIWRSLGWFMILPFIIYGTLAMIRRLGWRHLGSYLGLFVWVSALMASYRAPSYQWDNPRYRAIFLLAQAVVAGWAWWSARKYSDPWLKHIILLTAGNSLIFTYWYLGRYTNLPKLALAHNLILIVLFSALYLTAAGLQGAKKALSKVERQSDSEV